MLSFGNPLTAEFRYVGLSWDLVRTVFVGVLWVLCCLYYLYYLLVLLRFLYEKIMCYVVIREAFLYNNFQGLLIIFITICRLFRVFKKCNTILKPASNSRPVWGDC